MEQRLIDRKTIEEAVENTEFNNIQDAATALQLVTECPTIDPLHALGACYCRECKFNGIRNCLVGAAKKPTDFCSYGERKQNEILD